MSIDNYISNESSHPDVQMNEGSKYIADAVCGIGKKIGSSVYNAAKHVGKNISTYVAGAVLLAASSCAPTYLNGVKIWDPEKPITRDNDPRNRDMTTGEKIVLYGTMIVTGAALAGAALYEDRDEKSSKGGGRDERIGDDDIR